MNTSTSYTYDSPVQGTIYKLITPLQGQAKFVSVNLLVWTYWTGDENTHE